MTRGRDDVTPDRRTVAAKTPRRFRLRIRDWLIAVVLVALLAAGMAQTIRSRRLQADRELAEAIRLQEKILEARKAVDEAIREADTLMKEWDTGKMKPLRDDRDGVFPDPDRKGLPDSGRTVL